MSKTLDRFESMGDNCEFAFFLKDSGVDEASLFRWTLIKNYHSLLRLVKNNFVGLSAYENLTPSWQDMVLDKAYDICFHTEMYSDQVDGNWTWRFSEIKNKNIYRKEIEKINYLITKLKKSLSDDNKIFVIKCNDNNIEDIALELSKEFLRYGNSKVLYVKDNLPEDLTGKITKINNNFYIGAIDRFAAYNQADNYSKQGWQALINEANRVM